MKPVVGGLYRVLRRFDAGMPTGDVFIVTNVVSTARSTCLTMIGNRNRHNTHYFDGLGGFPEADDVFGYFMERIA